MAVKTPKLGLNKPGSGEYGWDALLGQNIDTLDAVVGGLLDERAVTGTATGGSTTTLDDSGASWGANAWAGAIVVIRRGGVVLRAEQVTSNTATQLVFASGATVQAGDAYTIMAQANAIPLSEKGAPGGVATLDPATGKLVQMPTAADVGAEPANPNIQAHIADTANPHGVTAAQVGAIPAAEKGAANGVATLDSAGNVLAAQLGNAIKQSDVWVSGWFAPSRAADNVITLAHNLGAIPRLVQLIVHDLNNGAYYVQTGTNQQAANYSQPLTVRFDAANVYLDVWAGAPLCRWWRASTSSWVIHDNCQWQVVAVK